MADAPEIAKAKERLRGLVVPAVETLEELMGSDHAGIRLGASREILDRGGVPAKHDHNVHVDLTMDEEIEELIAGVRRQVEKRNEAQDSIEDAILIEDPLELPLGEQVRGSIGVPVDAVVADAETLDHEAPIDPWWQARAS